MHIFNLDSLLAIVAQQQRPSMYHRIAALTAFFVNLGIGLVHVCRNAILGRMQGDDIKVYSGLDRTKDGHYRQGYSKRAHGVLDGVYCLLVLQGRDRGSGRGALESDGMVVAVVRENKEPYDQAALAVIPYIWR
jgi:hypothetical protein